MATLTVKEITRSTLAFDLGSDFASADAGGDDYKWGSDTVFLILDATGSQTVTATRQTTSVGSTQGVATLGDINITTSAGNVALLDTRDESFKDSSGNVNITYSAVTGLEVVPVKFPKV